jgi:16S rRNA processing protein RimM
MLEVGRVGKVHGLRGEVVVTLTTDRTERVSVGAQLEANGTPVEVAASRAHQDKFLVRFVGCDQREDAEWLRGAVLTAAPLEDDGTLWVHELVGATVVELDGTERGVVAEVEANPASDLLVLDSEHLVPLTFLVSFADGVVTVDTPAGLFDTD